MITKIELKVKELSHRESREVVDFPMLKKRRMRENIIIIFKFLN